MLFIWIAVSVVAFVVGLAIGASNASTVTNSIAVIKAAEQRAKNTLDTITAHKAS